MPSYPFSLWLGIDQNLVSLTLGCHFFRGPYLRASNSVCWLQLRLLHEHPPTHAVRTPSYSCSSNTLLLTQCQPPPTHAMPTPSYSHSSNPSYSRSSNPSYSRSSNPLLLTQFKPPPTHAVQTPSYSRSYYTPPRTHSFIIASPVITHPPTHPLLYSSHTALTLWSYIVIVEFRTSQTGKEE